VDIQDNCDQKTCGSTRGDDAHRLPDDLTSHRTDRGPKRNTDADLGDSMCDVVCDDTVDTDRSKEQKQRAEYCKYSGRNPAQKKVAFEMVRHRANVE